MRKRLWNRVVASFLSVVIILASGNVSVTVGASSDADMSGGVGIDSDYDISAKDNTSAPPETGIVNGYIDAGIKYDR